jgi:hypothetical protein
VEKIFVAVIPSRKHNVHPVRTEQPRKRLLECCQLERSLAFARDDEQPKSLRQDSHRAERYSAALEQFLPHTQGRNRLASTNLP